MAKLNQQMLRTMNTKKIFSVIASRNLVTKQEICDELHLSFATVSKIVDHLVTQGFVILQEVGISSGGRKPLIYRFNPSARISIVIDLSPDDQIDIFLIDLKHNILKETSLPADIHTSIEDIVQQLTKSVETLCFSSGIPHSHILGVGVALPGLYNAHDDVVINSLKPYLRGIHIRKVLAESLHKPVIVENDANMAVHGHFAAHDYIETNLLLLNFTDGIGLGLILNGQPFYGTHGFAGEVGNIIVSHPSRTLPFRFEDVCTLSSIIESFEQLQLIKKNNPIGSSIENLRTLIETDNTAQQILIYTGEIIGTALSTLVDLFNPHSIIIGGNIVVFKDILEPIIIKCVKKNSFIAEHADFAIRYESELSRFIAIGCNVKVIQQWLQTWIP